MPVMVSPHSHVVALVSHVVTSWQTQLEVNQETTLESLRLARAAGVLTILNTAPGVPDLDKVGQSHEPLDNS